MPAGPATITKKEFRLYDADKRPCMEWNEDARQDYTYTSKHELLSVTTTNASAPELPKTLAFTYYSTGQRETMQRPDEASPVRYYYDAMNRLAVLEDETNGGRFDFEYDGYGRRSKLSFPNGLTTYYEYTAAGAQESILTIDASGVPLQSWVYAHDSAGNPISKTDIDGNVERYGYDSRGRLVRTDYPDGTTTPANGIETPYARYDGYRYDPVGNRIEEWREHGTEGGELHVSASFDAANRLNLRTIDPPGAGADQDTETYRWMAQGALLTRTLTPAVGSVEVSSWTYDAADRLVSYTIPGEGSVSADYDTRGRRVGVSQTDTATATTTERRVVFDGLQEVSEYDGDSAADPSVPTRTQTTTRRLDEVIGSSLPPGPGETERPWRTHHGDLIQSGTLTADRDGGVESRGRYRAYGEALEGGDASWGFAGRPHEVGGMVPLRARAYAPGLGAFVSADPLDGYEGMPQTQADYGYAAASPERWTDPTGELALAARYVFAVVYLGVAATLLYQLGDSVVDLGKRLRKQEDSLLEVARVLASFAWLAVFLKLAMVYIGIALTLLGGTERFKGSLQPGMARLAFPSSKDAATLFLFGTCAVTVNSFFTDAVSGEPQSGEDYVELSFGLLSCGVGIYLAGLG